MGKKQRNDGRMAHGRFAFFQLRFFFSPFSSLFNEGRLSLSLSLSYHSCCCCCCCVNKNIDLLLFLHSKIFLRGARMVVACVIYTKNEGNKALAPIFLLLLCLFLSPRKSPTL
jgi:hypothetical protein